MTLIVEDGTGIADANSYSGLDTVRDYAAERGAIVPAGDSELEAMAIRAMDYLDGRGVGLLSLRFPPDGGAICGLTTAAALTRLSRAQAQLCIEQSAGADLAPARMSAFVTEETVGPITTKYSDRFGPISGHPPTMPAVDALLRPFASCAHGGGSFRTVRV